jgi:starvation-inducible DNA-binding protein
MPTEDEAEPEAEAEMPDEEAGEAESAPMSGGDVCSILCQELANAVAIWTNFKHYHWQLAGPRFYTLHTMFGGFADDAYSTIDDLAERVRMLGENPPSSLADWQKMTQIKPSTATSDDEMMMEAFRDIQFIIKNMRKGAHVADSEGDAGSVDMFSKFVQIYEKQHWFLLQMLS